jgi:hypothetical protein
VVEVEDCKIVTDLNWRWPTGAGIMRADERHPTRSGSRLCCVARDQDAFAL